VPPAVVTEILPAAVPAGTTKLSDPADTTVKLLRLIVPSLTAVAPPRFVPTTVTTVPAGPLVGEKLLMAGTTAVLPTVNLELLVAVPPAVVTAIFPVFAPVGIPKTIFVEEITVKVAVVPLNFTAVAPSKLAPVSVTEVPTPPEVGVKLEMLGTASTVKAVPVVAVPPAVVTVIRPVVAPVGTVAASCTDETKVTLLDAVPLNFTVTVPA